MKVCHKRDLNRRIIDEMLRKLAIKMLHKNLLMLFRVLKIHQSLNEKIQFIRKMNLKTEREKILVFLLD